MVDGSDADEKTKACIVKERVLMFASSISSAAKTPKEKGDKSNSCRKCWFSIPYFRRKRENDMMYKTVGVCGFRGACQVRGVSEAHQSPFMITIVTHRQRICNYVIMPRSHI